MKQDLELKLQAYLDGELPSREAKDIRDLVAQDAEVRDLLAELTHTRSALAGFEAEIKLPETGEFYWSKIARDIQREARGVPGSSSASLFLLLRRWAVPSGVLVALSLFVGVLVVKQQMGSNRHVAVLETETAKADAGTFTYRDFASGTTLVWLSYPAEREFAGNGGAATISWE